VREEGDAAALAEAEASDEAAGDAEAEVAEVSERVLTFLP
jgi:hypothetical protein